MPGLPGVVMTRQGPLGAFTAKIREVMSETGKVLGESGQLRLSSLDFQESRSAARIAGVEARTGPCRKR